MDALQSEDRESALSAQLERIDLTDVLEIGISSSALKTFDGWLQAGQRLLHVHNSVSFAIGDLLIYGFAAFGDKAAELSDLRTAETCRKAVYVCRNIPIERRRSPPLSFRHHDAVAALDPALQDELLELAVKQGWGSRELRKEIQDRKDAAEAAKVAEAAPTAHYRWPEGMEPEVTPPAAPTSGLVKRAPLSPANGFDTTEMRETRLAEEAEISDRASGVYGKELSEAEEEELARAREIVSSVIVPPADAESTDDHAAHLYSIARTTKSPGLSAPLMAILEERMALIRVVIAARAEVQAQKATPALIIALAGHKWPPSAAPKDG